MPRQFARLKSDASGDTFDKAITGQPLSKPNWLRITKRRTSPGTCFQRLVQWHNDEQFARLKSDASGDTFSKASTGLTLSKPNRLGITERGTSRGTSFNVLHNGIMPRQFVQLKSDASGDTFRLTF
jgi:hypothetical protein